LASGDNPPVSELVDIHAHLIPGIDDGPPDLAQSFEMARAAVEAGIRLIACTPHIRFDFPDVHLTELASRCEDLAARLSGAGIDLEIASGGELALTWALAAADDELRLASYGQRGTDILIEAPMVMAHNLPAMLAELADRGYRTILAHPERCPDFQRDDALPAQLVEQGVVLQVNAEAVLGNAPRPQSRLARRFLGDGLAQAIASDGHRGVAWRPVTALAAAADAAAELVGPELARWLTCSVPAAIIAGDELPRAPEMVPQPRRRWYGLRGG
jgi:protein-tyrosine phosphatase